MANLTLAVDDELLRRARIRAAHEGTSVNAVVREQLERYARAEHSWDGFLAFAAESRWSSGAAGRTWSRDDLYERG